MKRIFAICLALCSCAGPAPTSHGIPNFHAVAPGIWRGGQPSDTGWAYLKSIGVTRDLKLNTDREGSDSGAEVVGIRILRHPINLEQQIIGRPDKATIDSAVSDIIPGTFIHCEHGEDRTGLIVGIWRHRVQGWDKAKAYGEMIALGFHPILHGLWEAWEEEP